MVIVPTIYLKQQWEERLITTDAEVLVVNSAVLSTHKTDLLILDEYHCYASDTRFALFDKIEYKYILGLTATLERLDGKHDILAEKAPVVANVTLREASREGWVSSFREYNVLIKPSHLHLYKKMNKSYHSHFAYFDHDFSKAMACLDKTNAQDWAQLTGQDARDIQQHAVQWMRQMQKRKSFIYDNPAKIKVAQEIIKARPGVKTITFSQSIDAATNIGVGEVYHSKQPKKARDKIMQDFIDGKFDVLNSAKGLDLGMDVAGLGLGIVTSGTSSMTQRQQRRGRVIRKEGDKFSEFFNLVLEETQDESWSKKSGKGSVGIIDIPYDSLKDVLRS